MAPEQLNGESEVSNNDSFYRQAQIFPVSETFAEEDISE